MHPNPFKKLVYSSFRVCFLTTSNSTHSTSMFSFRPTKKSNRSYWVTNQSRKARKFSIVLEMVHLTISWKVISKTLITCWWLMHSLIWSSNTITNSCLKSKCRSSTSVLANSHKPIHLSNHKMLTTGWKFSVNSRTICLYQFVILTWFPKL